MTHVHEILTSETVEFPVDQEGQEILQCDMIEKISLLRVALLQLLWLNLRFSQTLSIWERVSLKHIFSSYRNLRKCTSSIYISMSGMHYGFLWNAEKCCSTAWIWKGPFRNWTLLVAVSLRQFHELYNDHSVSALGVVFLTRATIDYYPVFHPKQNAKLIFNKKNVLRNFKKKIKN